MMKQLLLFFLLLTTCGSATAREIHALNDGWRFFFGYENGGDNARPVTLPHTWNYGIATQSQPYLQTQGNYIREIYIPHDWQSKRLFVRFYGVQNCANLFVNGIHCGEHRGGSTAFTFEITNNIRFGTNNTLLVAVNNAPQTDILPTVSEHNLYGGISRDVELLVTDATAISPLYLGTDGILIHPNTITKEKVEGMAEIHMLAANESSYRLTLRIVAPDGNIVFIKSLKLRADQKPVLLPFTIERPQLWSTERPFLYRVSAEVEGDCTTDKVALETGFRTIDCSATTGFSLNKVRVPMRGIALTYDRPQSGNVLSEEDYAADVALLKELGANALRSPFGPHGQTLYNRCDQEGLLVWIDLPLFRTPFLGDISYYCTPSFEENGLQQLREIIAQNINHPSVVMWGIFSSLRPLDQRIEAYISRLNRLAHDADPSRPTVASSNQNGTFNTTPDLIVWRQDVGWQRGNTSDILVWSNQLHKNWGTLRSGVCYGAEGCSEHQDDELTKASTRTLWLPERRQTQFHEEYARQLEADTLFWGLWIDQLADFGSARRAEGINSAGLVSFDRHTRKDAFYLYKALWNKQTPTLHIVEKRWTPRLSEKQVIKVYASEGTLPILRINGEEIALTRYAPCQYRTAEITLRPTNLLEVTAGTLTDRAEIRIGNALKQPMPMALLQTTNPLPIN
ncbi:MAG: glycoside hydrolase family 2 TIM barrel-domain containing protein [Alistipes sp.]